MTTASGTQHRRCEPRPEARRTFTLRSSTWSGPASVLLGSVALAVASLAVPASIAFDPWAWLVWGREVVDLDLATTGGPSWKPLPVVVTSLLALTGSAAPVLWTVLARTAGFLLLAAVFRLASRYAGRVAGSLALVLVVLTPDDEPRFLRTFLEAHDAPMTGALALWAVDRHLSGKHAHAVLLTTGLALLRPEAWPFLGLYALWCWGRDPQRRAILLAALAVVPVLWFGGDLWGSGDPLQGAEAAQVAAGGVLDRALRFLGRAGDIVVIPAWFAATAAVVLARRRGERELPALAGLALAWCAVVVVMGVVWRYAAISRFFLPAAALIAVLASVGAVRVARALPRDAVGAIAAALLVVGAVALSVPRVLGLADVAEEVALRDRLQDDLDEAIERAGGPGALTACEPVAVDTATLLRPALAWKLELPVGAVVRVSRISSGTWLAAAGGRTERAYLTGALAEAELVARSQEWVVLRVGCGDPESRARGVSAPGAGPSPAS